MAIDRSIPNSYRNQIRSGGIYTAYLLAIEYPSGTVRFTDYAHDIEFDGVTYLRANNMLTISTVTETGDIETSPVVVELSGLNEGIIAALYLYSHINRALTLLRAILRADGELVGVVTLFDGLTTSATILDAAPAESAPAPIAQIEAASHFGDLDQKRGRYTNDESQKDIFPGDKGFEFVTELVEPLVWGRRDKI